MTDWSSAPKGEGIFVNLRASLKELSWPSSCCGTKEHRHVAELTDNDVWRLLIKLARELGQDDMAGRFQTALEEEDRHLASLRVWMEQICLNEAGSE